MTEYSNKYLKYKTKYINLKVKLNQGNQIGSSDKKIKISIQNPPKTPWLDWIESGIKKYEGRLNRGIFHNINIKDTVTWFDKFSGKEVNTKITDLRYYNDFGEAFEDLGGELVPIKGADIDTVEGLYSKYFSKEDINKYGVVAIGVEPI